MRTAVVTAVFALLLSAGSASAFDWRGLEDPSALPEVPASTELAPLGPTTQVARTWYEAWNGQRRGLRVAMPADALLAGSPLPLVVAVRPSGGSSVCAEEFGDLPGLYGFVVVCPDGQGAFSRGYSFAAPGQIDDLARMPDVVRERLPLLRIDTRRVVIVGVSMGASEALLAALRHPQVFARAGILDPTVDLRVRYEQAPPPRRRLMRAECDGPPSLQARCFAERSPIDALPGAMGGPLISLWFSETDAVAARADQVPAFIEAARSTPVGARLRLRVGTWRHAALWWDPAGRIALLADMGFVPHSAGAPIDLVRRTSAPIERRDLERERPTRSKPEPDSDPPAKRPATTEPERERPQVSSPVPAVEPDMVRSRPSAGRLDGTSRLRLGLRFASGPRARLEVPLPAPGEQVALDVPLQRDGWPAGTWRFEVRREGAETIVRMTAPVRGNPGAGPMRGTIADGMLRIVIPLEPGRYSGFPRLVASGGSLANARGSG